MLQRGVRNLRDPQVECSETGERRDELNPGVTNLGAADVQALERREAPQARCSRLGDVLAEKEVQLLEPGKLRHGFEGDVGYMGLRQVQALKVL